MSLISQEEIQVSHNAGFFSVCTIRLLQIIQFLNEHHQFPIQINNKGSFRLYRPKDRIGDDLCYDFFEMPSVLKVTDQTLQELIAHLPIKFCAGKAHRSYRNNDPNLFQPLMKIYFQPSNRISQLVTTLEQKYQFDYPNTCALYYRGTDKKGETPLPSHQQLIDQVFRLPERFNFYLLQSDEFEFIQFAQQKLAADRLSTQTFQENTYAKSAHKNVHYHQSANENYQSITLLLAIVIIISKCHTIILNSSNVSLWITFFRGHTHQVYQYLNQAFLPENH